MPHRWILWSIVAAYMVFVFVKGVLKGRQVGDTDDFLVAGRRVPWFFLFCTMGATVIGGGYSVGAIGKTYDWGVLMLLVSTGGYLHFIFSGLVVAPQFRRAELYTVAGYFGHRFGERSRFLVLVLSLLFSVFIVAAQMAAFGTVLAAILPEFADVANVLRWAIVIGGTMVVIYSTAGGLLAVIHTDIYQFIVLLLGFVITLAYCIPDLLGSWGHATEIVPANFFRLEGGKGWLFLITTFLAFLFGETFAPGYATRYCVGKNIRETRIGIAGVGFFLALFFPAVLFFIALYARIHFPDIDPQQALPMVVQKLNNPVIGGVIIGALLMAVMSSADSALNSATAIFVKDL
ncbi:MAG: sodium:solute symporter family protein, partial [Phycisphaerae bacterium]|nr:sodium:solute symporter family protein [Phycisphaerae bacterium]